MALQSMATDLQTRQTVWISTNTKTGNQANSHTRPDRDWDGLSAADYAGLSAHRYRSDVLPCPLTGWSKN
jgi:hypothetical protein